MQTVKTILIFMICVMLLGACGLKGPLYLPEDKPASGQTAADQDAGQEKDKDKDKDKKKDGGVEQPAINP
jgi:predicted small lipoprotein YifL